MSVVHLPSGAASYSPIWETAVTSDAGVAEAVLPVRFLGTRL